MPVTSKPNPFDQDFLPIWCESCNEQGYIFDKDVVTHPFFVVCGQCKRETSSVYCSKCQMGGEYVENIQDRPGAWTCPGCKTKYPLPAKFYDIPKSLYLESDLPENVLDLVRPRGDHKPAWLNLAVIVGLFSGIPFVLGGLAGLAIDAKTIIFTGFISMFCSIIGFCAPVTRQPSLQNWIGVLALSLSPLACMAAGLSKEPQVLAAVVAYLAGITYGIGLARFLVWYSARGGKINPSPQK